MNCTDIETLGPLYLSGELDAQRSTAFSEHLDACRACADKLEQWTELDGLLLRDVVSEDVDCAALDRQVREDIVGSRRRSLPMHWLAAAACVVVAFLIGVLIQRGVFAPQPPHLCVAAARDYHNEVILGQPRRWLSNPTALANLAKRNGISGVLLTSLIPAGYRLEHGKLCYLDGPTFLHLVYADGARKFSIYLRALGHQRLSGTARDKVNGKILYEAEAGPEHVAYFQTGRLTAMFVTDQSGAAALSYARSAALAL